MLNAGTFVRGGTGENRSASDERQESRQEPNPNTHYLPFLGSPRSPAPTTVPMADGVLALDVLHGCA